MTKEAGRVEITHEELDGCLVVYLDGTLDSLTYGAVRDSLLTLALEEPRAIIAVLSRLDVGHESFLGVFSSVWMRVNEWPDVPIFLVTTDNDRRTMLAHSAIARFVPVHAGIAQAIGAAKGGSPRRRRLAVYPPVLMVSASARDFVRETCQAWQLEAWTADALCLASELVENAIEHARTDLELRLELHRGTLAIAVRDGNPAHPVLRQGHGGRPHGYGLQIVADLAKAWGCLPDRHGGKVTWAVLTAGPRWLERHPAWPVPAEHPWPR
ncbi:ATP-binding protein [Amycolatopsis sp. GM8]|uniref:ATP-binding protein n=1 Tax=Amycolatopsis sp. GM8 TaxID=2896530 RepID=UPI001F2036A8|nr:ATP-binding protein [Amycolatopsis sp. GM8]